MDNVKAIVLRAAGINCDLETEHALKLAGAQAERVHINRVIDNPAMLDGYQIIVFPGGFSYGDDVAAGKVLANQVVHHLSDILHKFIEDSGCEIAGVHEEEYLTRPDAKVVKTIIRYPVKKKW